MNVLRPTLAVTAALTLLTGAAYPLALTGLARLLAPRRAGGSLIVRDGRVLGSELIAQPTEDPRWFWGRLTQADALHSGGSNRSAGNPALAQAAEARIQALWAADPGSRGRPVPADLVTTSGSGLDPHLSPAAAAYQVPRVARARGLGEAEVRALVARATEPPWLGVLGEPRVNVLRLNLSLEAR